LVLVVVVVVVVVVVGRVAGCSTLKAVAAIPRAAARQAG
jgi:hypothetical protein